MLENGVLVEGYRIDRLIGEGGMGVVYEATQLSLERKVALKLLSTELSADAGFRERFRHEARIQGALDHPNIVTVHEAGESEFGLFIAMELIRGATLKDMVVGRELDAGRTLRILGQVADALDSAHEAGLIHRDIKPHNILVRSGRRDHAYLADFGVTKVRGGTNLTKTGQFVGTVDYMAPEQIRGEPASRATDVYALGTVLYECLSGAVPFPKDSDVAVMYAHLADPPPRITQERPELPPELDAVISTAMAKNPEERYPSAMRMMEAFEVALTDGARGAVTTPRPVEEPEEVAVADDDLTGESPMVVPVPETAPGLPRADETMAAPVQQTPAPETEVAASPAVEETEPAGEPAGATVGSVAVGSETVAAAGRSAEAAPSTAAAPEAAPSERRTPVPGVLVWGAAALVVVGLAVAGFFVGHSGGGKTASAPDSGSVSAGRATVAYPAGWRRLPKVPTIPSVSLDGAVAVAPAATASSGLVLGTAALSYPYLQPLDLVGDKYTKTSSSSSDVVRLGKLQGYRTTALRYGKATPLYTVFTIPQAGQETTTAVICFSSTGNAAPLQDCQRVAGGITVSGAKFYDLAPSSTYAKRVNAALTTLNRSRAAGIKQLNAAQASGGQATAARAISKAYSSARRRIRKAYPTSFAKPANGQIAAALQSTAGAYRSLASAAAAESSSRYATARKAVGKAEQSVDGAVAQLIYLGYKVS